MRERKSARPAAVLFAEVCCGIFSVDSLQWISDAFARHDQDREGLPLERRLGLQTRAQAERDVRDYWLRQVADKLLKAGAADLPGALVTRAAEVRRQLQVFMTRGRWRAWCGRQAAPLSATPLQTALFEAAKALGEAEVPSAKQIGRVLRLDTECP